MHQTGDVVQKRASIWNINSLRTKYPSHSCRTAFPNPLDAPQAPFRGSFPSGSPTPGGAVGPRTFYPSLKSLSWARVLIASCSCFYLIFRSLILFSLSLFLRIRMNWLKKCSWSFFFWTRRKRWSRPYFSANSLKVVLWKRRHWEAGAVPSHPQAPGPTPKIRGSGKVWQEWDGKWLWAPGAACNEQGLTLGFRHGLMVGRRLLSH